tara:strand:+ start:15142 stop:16248 length:1107 start_codon:yes stop_codon:yes gene_type:complete
MAITIEVNGVQYTKFESVQIELQLDAMCNSFSMDVVTTGGASLPFQGGESCVLYVDGIKKVTGTIEACDGSYNGTSHQITYYGRDKTADILDSSLEAIDDLTPPISLKSVCEKVISQIGSSLSVVEGTTIEDFNKAEDIISPETGDNAYNFLQQLASKRQVLLSSNADGNLLLTQANPVTSSGRLQNKLRDNTNNVISADWRYDTTERFNLYVSSSQLNPTALNFSGQSDLTSLVKSSGRVSDTQIKAGRQNVFKAEKTSSNSQCLNRAKWELNVRKARGTTYGAKVEGHTIATDNTELWDTNALVQVLDEFAGISSNMLVDKITFTTDLDGGDETDIQLVNKDSYTLTISEPQNEPAKIGSGLFVFE